MMYEILESSSGFYMPSATYVRYFSEFFHPSFLFWQVLSQSCILPKEVCRAVLDPSSPDELIFHMDDI